MCIPNTQRMTNEVPCASALPTPTQHDPQTEADIKWYEENIPYNPHPPSIPISSPTVSASPTSSRDSRRRSKLNGIERSKVAKARCALEKRIATMKHKFGIRCLPLEASHDMHKANLEVCRRNADRLTMKIIAGFQAYLEKWLYPLRRIHSEVRMQHAYYINTEPLTQ